MTPADLLARALAAPPDSAARILYATAAFDAVTQGDVVLVGGAAQVTHTGIGRLTDIDVVTVLTDDDVQRLAAAGFRRLGRHWVYEDSAGTIAIEVPASELTDEESFEEIDVGGVVVRVITATDLMMDRLLQASDGTAVTRREAEQLAVAAGDRIDWDTIHQRATTVGATSRFLGELPALAEEFQSMALRSPSDPED